MQALERGGWGSVTRWLIGLPTAVVVIEANAVVTVDRGAVAQ